MREFEPKEIFFNRKLDQKLLEGFRKVYEAVTATMGPGGNRVIYPGPLYPVATKDGVSVARMIKLEDRFEDLAAQMLIQAANKQVLESGDGTTLTVLLAYEIYKNGLKLINRGVNRSLLKKGMQVAVDKVVGMLKYNACLTENEDLEAIARISTNGHDELAKIISNAIIAVGEYGIVTHEKSRNDKNYLEHADGYQWAKGIMYPEFISNMKGEFDFENVHIIVGNAPIVWAHDLKNLAELTDHKATLIINPNVRDEALGALRENNVKAGYHFAVVSPEQIGLAQEMELEDIAALTGAKVITTDCGVDIKSIKMEHIGIAKRVVSTLGGKTTIYTDKTKTQGLEQRINYLKKELESKPEHAQEKRIERSLAKLTGGIAVIYVAGATETEQKELMDRVDDAILACKSAQQEGIVDGGGVEFLCYSEQMKKFKLFMTAEDRGYEIVRRALVSPIKKILNNADIDSNTIIPKLKKWYPCGYDVYNRIVIEETMMKMEIVDPVKVLRTALQNAVSVAGMMLQTTVGIHEKKYDDMFSLKLNAKGKNQ